MQIKEMIEKIVQGDVILMSTNCVRKELKFLGVTCMMLSVPTRALNICFPWF